MAPKSAAAAAAREERRRNFAEQMASALKEDASKSGADSTSTKKKTETSSKPTSRQTKQAESSGATAAPSSAPPTPKVSLAAAEELIKFFMQNVMQPLLPKPHAMKMIQLVHDELTAFITNPRLLLGPGTVIDHDLVKKVLVVQTKQPGGTMEERKLLCEQSFLHGALVTPKEQLPPDLRAAKEALRLAALGDARHRSEARDPEGVKFVVNELLSAHGEPDYPFHELVEFPDPSVPLTGKSCQIALSGTLAELPARNPTLWQVVIACVQIYIDKASKIPGTLKFSPTRRF